MKRSPSSFQCKRKFERDCKEAERAQQHFEKMDADINVTKADVEKVCSAASPSLPTVSATKASQGSEGPRCTTNVELKKKSFT